MESSNLTNANLSGANLTSASLFRSTLTNANLTGADTRGAQSMVLAGATTRNAILPDGRIAGLDLAADDELVVRDYPTPIKVLNQMTIGDGGILQILFDVDAWESTISFQPAVSVALGGSLQLAFADGVAAAEQAGRTFDVFDWTGVAPRGAFIVESDYLWDLSNLYASGEVTLVSALAGDTDGDGQVGINDLNNVRNNFGTTGAPGMPGDVIPFDGVVDVRDLIAVRNNFGVTSPRPVPEPSSLSLAVFTLGISMSCVRRRRRI